MKSYSPKSIGWYIADKALPYLTTLVGIGAAKETDESVLEAIASGVSFPYELLIGGSFAKEAGEALLKAGGSMMSHPEETLAAIIGSYVVGKTASYMSERKRLKQVYSEHK